MLSPGGVAGVQDMELSRLARHGVGLERIGTGVKKKIERRTISGYCAGTMNAKLTYRHGAIGEFSYTPLGEVEIARTFEGGYVAKLRGEELPGKPVYASSNAAKLAVERTLLHLSRTMLEVLERR